MLSPGARVASSAEAGPSSRCASLLPWTSGRCSFRGRDTTTTARGKATTPYRLVEYCRQRNLTCQALYEEVVERTANLTYLQEYADLKEDMLGTSRKAGGALAAYLLFSVDGGAALCALLGSAASNLYLLWLFRDVDALGPETKVALVEAEQIDNPAVRNAAKLLAAYSHALQPRLVVLVGLAAGLAAFNAISPQPLDLAHQGCALGGFLVYKIPLIIKVAQDNAPKSYNSEEMSRPLIDKFDDELDQWGRPKRQLVPLPTDALPEGVDTSKLPSFDLGNMRSLEDAMAVLKTAAAPPQPPQQPPPSP